MRLIDFFGFLPVAGVFMRGLATARIARRWKEYSALVTEPPNSWNIGRMVRAARRGEHTLIPIFPEDIRAFVVSRWMFFVGLAGLFGSVLA